MERADFLEQPRLLVARGRLRSPRGEAFATRRRGGAAPGSAQASRIVFSLPAIDTTARRGCPRELRKTSRAFPGNCGDLPTGSRLPARALRSWRAGNQDGQESKVKTVHRARARAPSHIVAAWRSEKKRFIPNRALPGTGLARYRASPARR